MSVASIPDTSLGLTSSEIQILRQQQQIALQGHAGNGVARGRGTGRTSNSSSRATSAASSQGRLLLDPMSLRALSHQLDGLQAQIRGRIEYVRYFPALLPVKFQSGSACVLPSDLQIQLEDQMQASIQNSYDRAGNVIRNADAEIARTRSILASIDELDLELAKIGHIRDIVKGFRGRIETLDHRMDQSSRRRR
ncbi:hypothetical protein N7448_009121 [Penicillium atrosanguineum]|uniref:Biogenesis of lysosome-related organelles complex 1 subunit CNL1 n=1 Tax=Penicillium atrosanguineum TaxID=1132637 RepID=A0A9W9KUV2_9EURO|nr:uncharacterized protein N7443_006366 [Penicillium atrosanguineum]KAJ5123024.1 hypothetical protein N7448_009121 [Penicillium atrosanguineum]KAJ5141655.1 hypothetical protein N7526_002650 [Penicillium atrosanguineum]KAJ5298246.1 hypothetical protein N7443_006366 [Penicillium atrosanguineum]KAJ5321487.1 hypothetical protein N7476_004489 [Penicillium atrosanguineum]